MSSVLLLFIVMEFTLNNFPGNALPCEGSTTLLLPSVPETMQQRNCQKNQTKPNQNSKLLKSNFSQPEIHGHHHPKYFSPQTHTMFDIDLDIVFSEETNPDVEKLAIQCLAKYLGINEHEVKISSYHNSNDNGGTHYYFDQELPYQERSLRIINAAAKMNVVDGIVRSVGNTFYTKDKTRDVTIKSKTTAVEAILAFVKILEIQINSEDKKIFQTSQENVFEGLSFTETKITAALAYMQDLTDIFLVWAFEVDMYSSYYTVSVCAISNVVLLLVDQMEHGTYTAYPMDRVVDPDIDAREKFIDPMNKAASPQGWHQANQTLYLDTRGNNVVAQENHDGDRHSLVGKRAIGAAGLHFNAPFDPTTDDPMLFYEAAVTNLFYVTNKLHDIFYTYGFDEPAGNFQKYNYDRNVKDGENDPLIANAQYGAKINRKNNTYFRTPVDGESPRMSMLLFDERSDGRLRDSTFDNSLIIHEYLHGISRRLTGGRMNVKSLNEDESWGLAEGWSDNFAVVLATTKATTRKTKFVIGKYVDEGGYRHYPYCAEPAVNPSIYSDVLNEANKFKEKHDMGEIWTSILYEVYWDLRDHYGLAFLTNTDDIDWYKPPLCPDGQHSKYIKGNQLYIHLVIQGMKLQPPNPNYIQARDAILEADKTIYEGIHLDILWKAFARRGLGCNAKYPGVAGYKVPGGIEVPNVSPQKVWYITPKAIPVS